METPNVSPPVVEAPVQAAPATPSKTASAISVLRRVAHKHPKALIGGGVGAVVLLIVSAWMMSARDADSWRQDARYLPDDASFVATIQVEEALRTSAGQTVIEQIAAVGRNPKATFDKVATQIDGKTTFVKVEGKAAPAPAPEKKAQEEMADDFRKQFGLELANVVHLTIVMSDSGQAVQIVRLKNPVKAEAIDKQIPRNLFRMADGKMPPGDARKVTVGAHTIFEVPGYGADSFVLPEEKVVVYGSTDALKAILERNGNARLSAQLTETLGQADFSKTIALAAVLPKETPGPNWLGNTAMPETAAISVDLTDKIALSFRARFKDAKNAADVKTAFERALADGQNMTKFAEAVKLKQSDNQLTATATIAADSAVEAIMKLSTRTTNTFKTVGPAVAPAAPRQQK